MSKKAILISIQPKWCELIASGEKTIEIRKSRPKLETPFRCYIYCTKNGKSKWNGKIIGEFVCDEISGGYIEKPWGDFVQRQTCLTYEEINIYGKDKPLICWHISDLVLYKNPRELSEFYKPCIFEKEGDCGNILTRPPQSWCYVKE